MKRLLFLLAFALLSASALAQSAGGSAMGWYKGPLDANGCPVPDAKEVYACIYTNGAIKISSLGAAYADPTNMLTGSQIFTLVFDPVAIGPAGSTPTFKNIGTASAQEWVLTLPAATPIPKWTQYNCNSITGVMTLGGGGVVTITNAVGVNCTQQ